MTINHKQLAQSRPSGTSAVSLYAVPSGKQFIAKSIIVCNQSAGAETYSIYHDTDGTTYDQTTALFYAVPIAANETAVLEIELRGSDSTGNVAVQTSTASALTFTMYGMEVY